MKFFTIGYGGRNPEEFTSMLSEKGIVAIADVRLHPNRASMGIYVRAKSSDKGIQRLLSSANIEYHSLPELGNQFLEHEDWQQRYKNYLSTDGDRIISGLLELPRPFCLLCAEKRASECHRKLIADLLESRGWEVEHIE